MSGKAPHGDFRLTIIKALENLNLEKAARHSRLNHHTEGLDYLNLQRSDKFTLKMYLLAPDSNHNSGFLIHPHSHRYEFNTVVLAGQVSNLVFNDLGPNKPVRSDEHEYFADIAGGFDLKVNRFQYSFEEGMFGEPVKTWLEVDTKLSATYMPGDSYYLKTGQIHTLRTSDRPTLLCLSQFEDLKKSSALYLPRWMGSVPVAAETRIPTIEETATLRDRCLELLK